jgi:four helix bundle protein
MKDSPLRNKSLDFAVRVVQLSRMLRDEKREYALADQFLRSGTSIGANLSEAACAPSPKDFLNKCKISLKECSEALFWIRLFERCELLPANETESIRADCEELRKMLSASCKTVEERLADQ